MVLGWIALSYFAAKRKTFRDRARQPKDTRTTENETAYPSRHFQSLFCFITGVSIWSYSWGGDLFAFVGDFPFSFWEPLLHVHLFEYRRFRAAIETPNIVGVSRFPRCVPDLTRHYCRFFVRPFFFWCSVSAFDCYVLSKVSIFYRACAAFGTLWG